MVNTNEAYKPSQRWILLVGLGSLVWAQLKTVCLTTILGLENNNCFPTLKSLPAAARLPVISQSKLLSTRQCARDEVELCERCIQPRTEPGIPQFSLSVLQLKNKALIIVLESEPLLSGCYQMIFEGCFENNAGEQMVSCISDDGGHHLWLQGPFNLLTKERRANYVAAILL